MSAIDLPELQSRIAVGGFGAALTIEQSTIVLSFAIIILSDYKNWRGAEATLSTSEKNEIDDLIGQVSKDLMP